MYTEELNIGYTEFKVVPNLLCVNSSVENSELILYYFKFRVVTYLGRWSSTLII